MITNRAAFCTLIPLVARVRLGFSYEHEPATGYACPHLSPDCGLHWWQCDCFADAHTDTYANPKNNTNLCGDWRSRFSIP